MAARFSSAFVMRAGCTCTRIEVTSFACLFIAVISRGVNCFSLAATAALSAQSNSAPDRKPATRLARASAGGAESA